MAPRTKRIVIANFLTALAATFAFKFALFAYSVSGAEGESSPWLTWPRLLLCLGWDVVSAAIVGAVVTLVAVTLFARVPRAGLAWSVLAQAVYALFLLVSYHVAILVGAPLDKAAIDLMFLYSADSVRTSQALATSALPYVTDVVEAQAVAAVVLAFVSFIWFLRRTELVPPIARRAGLVLVAFVFLSVAAIPTLANGPLSVHTFGLERSPVTTLAGSYLRGPLRALREDEEVSGDPYCLDLRSPVPVDGANPLTQATPKRTNLLLVFLESVSDGNLKPAPTPMPFFEELGRSPQGVRIEQHYTHWPQTMNAEFSVWCSELPHPDYPPITYVNPSIPCISLSESLKAAGYDTALLISGDLGFDRKTRFLKHRRFDVLMDRNDLPEREGAWENGWGIDERVTTRALLKWVAGQRLAHADRPFFAA